MTKRAVIHIPFGLLLVLGARLHWTLPVVAAALFIFYERNEDHWIKDQAWKDVAGAMWGMGLGILAWAVWRLL